MTRSSDHPHCPECGQAAAFPYTDKQGEHGVRCPHCYTVYDCVTTIKVCYDTKLRDEAHNVKEDTNNANR